MVVIILSIAHTGGSGDMPPKVSCCFLTKSLKRKKSHTFPCPRYRIFQLAINKRDKVIFHWVSSLLWLTVQLQEFWHSLSKEIWMCDLGGAGQCSTVGPTFGHQPRLGRPNAAPETSFFAVYIWRCDHGFSLHLGIK